MPPIAPLAPHPENDRSDHKRPHALSSCDSDPSPLFADYKRKRRLTSRLSKVQDIPILLKHVDLLDTGNRLRAELFEGRLEFTVVPLLGRHGFFDLFTAGSAFAAY